MLATLQALRFIFVMMIFMSHFAYGDMVAFDAGGDCGVAFFFILSGFVLSLRYDSEIRNGTFSYRCYFSRRLMKFYPLHLLCLAAFLVVSGSTIDVRVLLNLLLLQSWVPDAYYYFSCNSVAWFLSSLLFCYVVFPFFSRRVNGWWLAGIIACYGVVYGLVPDGAVNAVLYVHPLVRFVDFYLGMVLFRLYTQWPTNNCQLSISLRALLASTFRWKHCPLSINTVAEVLLACLLIVSLAAYPWVGVKFRNAPLFWLVLLPMILVFAQGRGIVSQLLRWRPLLFLGSLTMPFFLTHQMIIAIVMHRMPDMPVVAMLFLCLLVTLTISWGLHILFSPFSR